jgi:hypothetical protein
LQYPSKKAKQYGSNGTNCAKSDNITKAFTKTKKTTPKTNKQKTKQTNKQTKKQSKETKNK